MPNLPISGLTAATTPLAGAELLAIDQSSTTKKVTVSNVLAIAKPRKLNSSIVNIVATGSPTDFQSYTIPANTCQFGGDTVEYQSQGTISFNGATGDTIGFYFSGQLLYTFTASNVGSLQSDFSVNFQVTYLNSAQGNYLIEIIQGPHTETKAGVVALLNWASTIVMKTVGTHLSGAGSFESTQFNVYLK